MFSNFFISCSQQLSIRVPLSILTNTGYYQSYSYWPLWWVYLCLVVLICTSWPLMLSIFAYASWLFLCILWWNAYPNLQPTGLLIIKLNGFFIYFGYKSFVRYNILCEYFVPVYSLPFCFHNSFFFLIVKGSCCGFCLFVCCYEGCGYPV